VWEAAAAECATRSSEAVRVAHALTQEAEGGRERARKALEIARGELEEVTTQYSAYKARAQATLKRLSEEDKLMRGAAAALKVNLL
jgi:predicted  nucleic acid-binding Zn-ribbon protein